MFCFMHIMTAREYLIYKQNLELDQKIMRFLFQSKEHASIFYDWVGSRDSVAAGFSCGKQPKFPMGSCVFLST